MRILRQITAGAPLVQPNGQVIGTVCVTDVRPRQLTPAQAHYNPGIPCPGMPMRRLPLLLACLLGYGVSFAGFDTLMKYVYPVIGYTGMVMIVVMVFGWARYRTQIAEETTRRGRGRSGGEG